MESCYLLLLISNLLATLPVSRRHHLRWKIFSLMLATLPVSRRHHFKGSRASAKSPPKAEPGKSSNPSLGNSTQAKSWAGLFKASIGVPSLKSILSSFVVSNNSAKYLDCVVFEQDKLEAPTMEVLSYRKIP